MASQNNQCAQDILDDPDDDDAAERLTASLHALQDAIVSVRQVLAPWDFVSDEEWRVGAGAADDAGRTADGESGVAVAPTNAPPKPPPLPLTASANGGAQLHVTADDIRKVKLRRRTSTSLSQPPLEGLQAGLSANQQLLNELRSTLSKGVALRKVEKPSAAERDAKRELSATEKLKRDLAAHVRALRGVSERRVLLDQDVQLGRRY